MISQRSIDEVLDVAVIEDVVGEYVTLKRSGSSYTGLCPFHDDSHPSFSVSPTKKIYKCFSCGKAGNAATFLMEHDQVTFFDAIRSLASKYNVELDETKEERDEADKNQKKRESLLIALEYARSYYTDELLNGEEGKTVGLSYFKERGLLNQTIEKFGLGYSKKGWEHFAKKALAEGYSEEVLIEAGLIREKESGGFFDFFRERVIFPIHNISGKVISFAGRALTVTDKGPKYINSPETEVYHKSKELYGIYQGKRSISKLDTCLLVEGYLDVITLAQNGIENVVASSGTALTPGQIRLVSRLTKNVVVLFDGDEAGLKAAKRGVDVILEGGLNVKVVAMPEGEDPDSYCKKIGGEKFREFVDSKAQDFIFFMADLLVEKAKGDPIKLVSATREILDSLAKIPDQLTRRVYIQELSGIVNQDETILINELNKVLKRDAPAKQREVQRKLKELGVDEIKTEGKPKTHERQEKSIIRLIVQSGDKEYVEGVTVAEFLVGEIFEDNILFSNEFYWSILNETKLVLESEEELSSKTFLFNKDSKIAGFSADLTSNAYTLSPLWEKNDIEVLEPEENYHNDVDSVLLHLKRVKIHQKVVEVTEKLNVPDQSEEDTNSILDEYTKLKEIEKAIAEILGVVVLK
jgi:DNA primase